MLVSKTYYILHLCCVCEHMPQHTCNWQRVTGSWFSPSTVWVPRIKLGSPGLVTSAFAHWATSLALPDFASTLTIYCRYPKHFKHLFLSGALFLILTKWFSFFISDLPTLQLAIRCQRNDSEGQGAHLQSDSLNSILRTHVVKGDNQPPHAVLWPPHTHAPCYTNEQTCKR